MKIQGLDNLLEYCELVDNYYIIDFDKLTEYEIDELLNINNLKLHRTLAGFKGLKSRHIDKLLSLNDSSIYLTISIYNSKFTNEQFELLLNVGNYEIITYLAFKKLNAKQANMFLKLQSWDEVQVNLIRNKSVSLKIKQKLINNKLKETVFK